MFISLQWRRTNEELIQSQNDLALSREEVKSLEKDRCSLQRKVMTLQDAVDSPGCKASLKRMLERSVCSVDPWLSELSTKTNCSVRVFNR